MNSFPETYIDPYYQLLKIGSVVNTVEIKQTDKDMHDRESFQEQAREREWRVTQGWSVGSGKKNKKRWRKFSRTGET